MARPISDKTGKMLEKIYCERGAYRSELRQLEREGLIRLTHFPYEGHNRKISERASPSTMTADAKYITADSDLLIGECEPSDKFEDILTIIGINNQYDARHLDSAYKSGCTCFLTPDKKDIAAHSKELQHLLGLRVFHSTENWNKFLTFVQNDA